MKKIFQFILALFAILSVMISCTDELVLEHPGSKGVNPDNVVQVGIPITSGMGMTAEITTKATVDQTGNDSQIHGVMLFIYENTGNPKNDKLLNWQLFGMPGEPPVEGETSKYEIPDPNDPTKGILNIYIPVGDVYIYLLANAKSSFMDFFTEILQQGKKLATRDLFVAEVKPKWNGNIHTVDGYLPMCGIVNNVDGACRVVEDPGRPGYGIIKYIGRDNIEHSIGVSSSATGSAFVAGLTRDNSFVLNRLMSKVTMNFINGKDVTFTPKTYQIFHCAQYVAPISDMISPALADFPTSDTGIEYFGMQTPMSFTVYIPENIRNYVPVNGVQKLTTFADRERVKKGADGKNLLDAHGHYDFMYAPPKSTFVQIVGSLEKKGATAAQSQSADVQYTIHLGDFGRDFNNFSVERDWYYRYNVTVNGVDDIKVEVGVNGVPEEKNPAVEGIVFEGGVRLRLDAHYEQVEMKFPKDRYHNGIYVYAQTPFGVVYCKYNPGTGGAPGQLDPNYKNFPATKDEALKLLKWVEFKKQTAKGTLASYKPKGQLDGVKDLFSAIDEAYANTGDSYYTCFVDEFYYDVHPVTNAPIRLEDFVNVEDRTFSIGSDIKYSADRHSAVADAVYMFQQRSIATFYDLKNDQVAKFGSESVDEIGDLVGPMKYGTTSSHRSDPKTGRTNTIAEIGSKTNVVNWAKNGFLLNNDETVLEPGGKTGAGRLNENSAHLACLTRNRDHNGNGQIDPEEIRWYTPALHQVLGLWIGEPAMPAEFALYPKPTTDLQSQDMYQGAAYPVFTSTDGIGRVVYGEQGTSFGDEASAGNGGYVCAVRNLGKTPSVQSYLTQSEPYYKYNPTDRTIEVYLTSNALRAYASRELAPHHERSDVNRLYRKFQIASHPYTVKKTFHCNGHSALWGSAPAEDYVADVIQLTPATSAKNSSVTLASRYKSDGEPNISTAIWRLPNQRELALMIVAMGNDLGTDMAGNLYTSKYIYQNHVCTGWGRHHWQGDNNSANYVLHCRTSFSNTVYSQWGYMYNLKDKKMQMIYADGGYLGMGTNGTAGYLCVRDVQK